MASKRSFQPPPVSPAEVQPGFGLKIGKFPKPSLNRVPATEGQRVEADPSPPLSTQASPSEGAGYVQQISLALIRKSPFQNRSHVNEDYVADLADNIRTDGLNNPIMVRPLADGAFELIAGENRYEAAKLNAESHIPAFVRDMNDKQAARSLVFDNVYHRQLTDYELYRGFRLLLDLDAVPSNRALAKDASLSHTQLNRIMAFGKLPKDARAILDTAPGLIGSSVADALARHAGRGRDELITEALEKIKKNELTQLRASAWIENRVAQKPASTSRVLTYAEGKAFCTVIRDGGNIRVKVAPGVDPADLEDAVFKALKVKLATFDTDEPV